MICGLLHFEKPQITMQKAAFRTVKGGLLHDCW